MILPIVAYGDPILRKRSIDLKPNFEGLSELISNMWETMYNATGCGLAAPQVNFLVRLFLIDSKATYEAMSEEERTTYFEGDQGIKMLFINPRIVEKSKDKYWIDEEGCLSIPGLNASVRRPWQITIEYQDEYFQNKTATFSGITARMIQHEYDHLEGKLYLDLLSPLNKQILSRKLDKILKGHIPCKYPMKFVR